MMCCSLREKQASLGTASCCGNPAGNSILYWVTLSATEMKNVSVGQHYSHKTLWEFCLPQPQHQKHDPDSLLWLPLLCLLLEFVRGSCVLVVVSLAFRFDNILVHDLWKICSSLNFSHQKAWRTTQYLWSPFLSIGLTSVRSFTCFCKPSPKSQSMMARDEEHKRLQSSCRSGFINPLCQWLSSVLASANRVKASVASWSSLFPKLKHRSLFHKFIGHTC